MPYLGSSAEGLTAGAKAAIGFEAFSMAAGGIAMAVSEIVMAHRVASVVSRSAEFVTAAKVLSRTFAPAAGMLAPAIMFAVSPQRFMAWTSWENRRGHTRTWVRETSVFGYDGDKLLGEMYGDRPQLKESLRFLHGHSAHWSDGFHRAGSVGCRRAVRARRGLTHRRFGGHSQGVQQAVVERIATKYANRIKDYPGGATELFATNLSAQNHVQKQNPDFQQYVTNLQEIYGVGSVLVVSSFQLSPTTLQLAADTKTDR